MRAIIVVLLVTGTMGCYGWRFVQSPPRTFLEHAQPSTIRITTVNDRVIKTRLQQADHDTLRGSGVVIPIAQIKLIETHHLKPVATVLTVGAISVVAYMTVLFALIASQPT